MRRTIKWTIRICVLLLSIDSFVWIIGWLGRWKWIRGIAVTYPVASSLLHGPMFPILCLGVALVAVYGKDYLKLPNVRAKYTNSITIPVLKKITVKMVVDTQEQNPGWDTQDVEWWWFIEVRLANDSETAITVENIEAKGRVGGNRWIRKLLPFTRRTVKMKHIKDISNFVSSPHEGQPKYEGLPGLFKNIKGIPLEKGVGHNGWICFSLTATQRELADHPSIDVWVIDALDGKHQLIYKKDDKNWDRSFTITEN
jgi:hypothetical protein